MNIKKREIKHLTKEDIIAIFLKQIFNADGVNQLEKNKKRYPFDEYRQRSSTYIFDKIAAAFSTNIRVSGLENVWENTPCFIAYPHSASILDGTMLTTLLLGHGIPAKALARVSTSGSKMSHRDLLYQFLEDYIIHLKQDKLDNGSYAPIARESMIHMIRDMKSVISQNGAVLIAPEGKTNPFQMGEVKDSIVGMAKKHNAPIIPCTIEYHHPLRMDSSDFKWGELFTGIEVTFHKPEKTIKNISQSIADGFVCRFKGGNHLSPKNYNTHNEEEYILNIKEKIIPILYYTSQLGEFNTEIRQLLIRLLEEEFGGALLHLREYLPYREDLFIEYVCHDIFRHVESDLIARMASQAA